jgi:hypothetical protein
MTMYVKLGACALAVALVVLFLRHAASVFDTWEYYSALVSRRLARFRGRGRAAREQRRIERGKRRVRRR